MPVRDQALGLDQLRKLFRGAPGGAGEPPGAGIERAGIVKEPAIDAPLLRPEPEIDAGAYIEPAVPPGYPWVAGQGPGEPVIVKADRYPKPPMLIDRRVLSAGQAGVQWQVGFPINSMRVDNWSNQFLLIRGAEVYVPPFAYGAIVEITPATQTLEVMWEAPPGQAEPGVVVGQAAHFWLYEDKLTPSPGSVLGSISAGSTVDISDRAARRVGAVSVVRSSDGGEVGIGYAPGDSSAPGYMLAVQDFPYVYNVSEGGWDRVRVPNVMRAGTSNSTSTIWTPASGKKFRLMGVLFWVTGNAAVAGGPLLTSLTLTDGSTDLFSAPYSAIIPAAAGSGPPLFMSGWLSFGNGFLSAAANNTLKLTVTQTLVSGAYSAIAVGTEE